MSERDEQALGIPEDEDIDLQLREYLEIEKMRNLEISRFDDEVDAIHKTKDKRITDLTEELWHSNRRADDLDRRWNDLAVAYEQVKVDLENTGRELDVIRKQASYRLVVGIVGLMKGNGLRALLSKLRGTSHPGKPVDLSNE